MSERENPYQSPQGGYRRRLVVRRFRLSAVEWVVIALIAIVMVAILWPEVRYSYPRRRPEDGAKFQKPTRGPGIDLREVTERVTGGAS